MSIWYSICNLLPFQWLSMNFMKNALLAVLIMAPLFGLLSTMIVTGRRRRSSASSPPRLWPWAFSSPR